MYLLTNPFEMKGCIYHDYVTWVYCGTYYSSTNLRSGYSSTDLQCTVGLKSKLPPSCVHYRSCVTCFVEKSLGTNDWTDALGLNMAFVKGNK